MIFKNALPEFYEEVSSLLVRMERNDLASQLGNLEIVWRCPCTDPGCASFKVSGIVLPDVVEIGGQRRSTFSASLELNADKGSIKLGLDQLGRINAFEILRRPDVRRKLFRAR